MKVDLNNIHQIILLDKNGCIHFSSDTIFSTNHYNGKSILNDNPFIESVFSQLLDLEVDGPTLRYSKMENPIPLLKGAFDFSFSRVRVKEGEFILWCVYDYSELYKKIKASQQRRNELELYKERLEGNSKKINSIQDF